jgi:hypothetical protein
VADFSPLSPEEFLERLRKVIEGKPGSGEAFVEINAHDVALREELAASRKALYSIGGSVIARETMGQTAEDFFELVTDALLTHFPEALDAEAKQAAEGRLAVTEDALRRIAENAESWHGDNEAKGRALGVIAGWAREALSRVTAPAADGGVAASEEPA